MTPTALRTKLEKAQANEWGYKTIKEANEDGMNVTRVSCDVSEVADSLKVSRDEAMRMVDEWNGNDLIKFVRVCGQNQVVFI